MTNRRLKAAAMFKWWQGDGGTGDVIAEEAVLVPLRVSGRKCVLDA